MATFTYPTDQRRLVDLLGLDRDELRTDSTLNYLMEEAERVDVDFPEVDSVTLILAAMTDAETARTARQAETQGVSSMSVSGEYSVSYSNPAYLSSENRYAEAIGQIKRYLDPYGQLGPTQKTRVIAS